MEGLSVIIVCHNGASRLPATLSHLKTQEPSPVPWEVLLVDNCSNDGTAEVAYSQWQNGPAPLRIVRELRLGVRYARERGLREARYAFLGFVDDDNWIAPDWVRVAYETISSDADLAAVGSIREAECEVPPPAWFESYHSIYAVLTDQDLKQMSGAPNFLPTAGLCLRKAAWEQLVRNGFQFLLSGSTGGRTQGGEDTELTLALHLAGWGLTIDSRLRLKHLLPRGRLKWTYLRRLLRSYGASHVPIEAYADHSLGLERGLRRWVSEGWWYQLSRSFLKIGCRPISLLAALAEGEGKDDVASLELEFGRVLGLLRLRGQYRTIRRQVREAAWRQPYSKTALARRAGRP
jgi:glycosyltransferase involved in cell wall biosynthesis